MAAHSLATILYPPPGSPVWLQTAAIAVLALHVGGGIVGLASGFTALFSPKGGRIHRLAGRVFLVSMLTMGAVAASVAPFMATQQWSNTIGGIVACYFVLTGWLAVRRPAGRLGWPETGAMVVPLGVLVLIVLGVVMGTSGKDGTPAPASYVMGTLVTLALASDVSLIWRHGLAGGQRLARHLWRLGAALLIATGSAIAQPRLAPPQLGDSPLALVPIAAILGMMLYWLVRLRLQGRRRQARPRARAANSVRAASA